jgi:ribosomal-protein-alanine N-acetyltransferase
MTVEDLDEVMRIERAVKPSPRLDSAYRHELEQNEMAHYWVLRPRSHTEPAGWRQHLPDLVRPRRYGLLGYAGYWLMYDEAHVSIIAVAPEHRRRGLGELLFLTLLHHAIEQGAVLATLEVRPSNEGAQALYRKYQFEIVGHRKRYYQDNHEDAHIMTVQDIQSEAYRAFLAEQQATLFARLEEETELQ